jgi:aspartate/methionine/tyrosine aminotransferase
LYGQKYLRSKSGFALSDEVLYKQMFLLLTGIFGSAGNNYVRISLCSPVEKFEDAIKRIKEHHEES